MKKNKIILTPCAYDDMKEISNYLYLLSFDREKVQKEILKIGVTIYEKNIEQ